MSQIFVSYSRKDEEFVSRLVSDLEREGWNIFYDRRLKPSDNYEEVLSAELAKAKYILVVLSQNSTDAASGVVKELQAGLLQERQRRTTVIPILIEPCDPKKIRDLVGPKLYADFTNNYKSGFEELSSALPKGGRSLMTSPRPSGAGEKRKMQVTKEQGIVVAVMGAIVSLVIGYWQFVYKPAPSDTNKTIQYSGRVLNSMSQEVVPRAKVSVDAPGLPQIYYTDSDGVFNLNLPANASVRIRVEANGYEVFERNVSLSRTGVEDVRLTPVKVLSPSNQNSPGRGNKKSTNAREQGQINRILSSEPSNRPN